MNADDQAFAAAGTPPGTPAPKRNDAASPLGFKEKLGYGLGDTASHFVWDMVGFWLLFFYTDVYKIPAAAAGTIMLVARFWDMAIDPVIGIVSDRTQTRWGKFRPYILFGAVPYAVLSILTFTTPNFGETGKILYAGATYVLLMTAYAAVNLPYSSLAAVMSSDTYERAGLNTYRFICAFIGQFVVTGLALTLAKYFGGGDKAMGFQYTVIVFGILSLVFFFITFMTTKERVQPSTDLPSSLKEDLKNLVKNRPWIILACVGIISFIMFAMQNAAIAYYFKYYIGKEDSVQLFNVIGTIALIVALPLSKPLAKAFGNRNVFIASSLLSGLCFIALYLPGEKDIVSIYVLNILAKMAYAPAVPLLWTMIADSSDYSEWKTGRRATGLYFSAATFAQKAGWGIGAAIAGWILTVYQYVPNAAQTDTSIHGIKLLVSVIPGILYMSCAVFMFFYTIDAKTTDLMKTDLDARRAQAT
ncbi:MAG: MFS transporter [Verrucomicrobia subdivision 3 bacterium]|nr:MFS transporter [Verrucomicrobiota bacterium]MCC6819286.1 MFS transporter [Limisphaerales bacterium]